MSNLSKVIYEADGSTSTFTIPFGYITRNHVRLFVNGKQMPLIWVNDSTISTYNFIPKVGDIVEIRRITPLDTKLVNFNPSAVLTDEELNVATKQNFFLLQELYENYNKVLGDIFNKAGWDNTGGTVSEIINSVAQSVLESALLAELQANLSHIADNARNIMTNIQLTHDVDNKVSDALALVDTRIEDTLQDVATAHARIDNVMTTYVTGTNLQAELDSFHDQIISEVSGGTVALENYYTKVESDQQIAGMKQVIGTERETYVAGILTNYYTKVDTDTAIAEVEQGILSTVEQSRAMALTGYYTKAQTDSAMAGLQTTLQSYTNNSIATALTAYYTETETDSAISSATTALKTQLENAQAAALLSYYTKVQTDSAIATANQSVLSQVNNSIATTLTDYYTKAAADQAIASADQTILSQMEDSLAVALTSYYTKTETNSAIASSENSIITQVNSSIAGALTSYYTKAQADSAIATADQTILSQMEDSVALSLTSYYTKTETDSAISTAKTQVISQTNSNTSSALLSYYTKTQTDSAIASSESSIMTQVDDSISGALMAYYTKTQTDSAIASSASSVIAQTNTNLAAALTDYYTKTGTDSAISSATTSLTSQVNGLTSSVQTQAQAIDGLSAQYTVKVDTNGYVSGFGLATTMNNGVPTSEFIVLADKFAVVTAGNNPVVPFAVDANGVYMPNAFIRDLQVEKINGGSVMSEWNLTGNGKIVMDTGTHVRVIGTGFGAQGNLIEWFGLKRPISQMSTSNSITHITNDGDAYFGGTLRSGIISNSVRSTNTASNASVVLGAFGSNGNSIVVNWGYSCSGGYQDYSQAASCPANPAEPTATIQLERKIGTGSWTVVQTKSVIGNANCYSEPGFAGHSFRMSSGFSYTDPQLSTADRSYRVTVTSRSVPYFSGLSQSLSINSTEE